MCGFFGVIDFNGNISKQDEKEIFAGSSQISYRGPDDNAFIKRKKICIGFQRLSIIDLSAKSQPFINEKNNVIMACNGEIYNHLELKNKLITKGYKFKTKTDTEVVLHGYHEWGDNLWGKLNGIFAIIIWDERIEKLFLVRDHMGVKPIHYFLCENRIYFGSDYNSFFSQTHKKLSVNYDAILSYLSFRYVIGEQTFYKNIKDVMPGTSSIFGINNIKNSSYWDIPLDTEKDKGENYYITKLDEKISTAVKRQLMSDVPLGAFISGGLDSSLLLYFMSNQVENLKAYVTGFEVEGYNEFKYADLMADSIGIKSNKLVLSPDEYMLNMDEVISLRGEPVSVPHEAAFLKMTRYMKNDISVVLSGEGADELFGGYGRIFRSPFDFYKHKIINKNFRFLKKLDSIHDHGPFNHPIDHFLWRYAWFSKKDKERYLNNDFLRNRIFDRYSLSYIENLFRKGSNKDYYRLMYYIQGKIHLPNLLNRLDRMSMGASVEARVPFLDYELVEFVSRMPYKYKNCWKNNVAKMLSILHNSDIISEKYDTPKYILKKLAIGKIPDEIIWRKKMGFPVPLDNWFNKGLKDQAENLLLDKNARIRDIINRKNLKSFISKEKINSSFDYSGKQIWMLLNIEIWMRKYF